MWEPVVYEVLLRLYGLGLWPNGSIRGWPTKVITEMTLKEEMKVIYNSLKSFRGEKSPWKHLSEVL